MTEQGTRTSAQQHIDHLYELGFDLGTHEVAVLNRAEEIASDVRALAATVAGQSELITALRDQIGRTISRVTALESPGSAEAAPEPVCAICGGAGKRYTNGYCEDCNGSGLITERVACANSDCGHTEDLHTHPAFGLGFCLRCPCQDYVPTVNQESPALDPVLVKSINELCDLVDWLAQGTVHMIGTGMCGEIFTKTAAIRAYGADAREGGK